MLRWRWPQPWQGMPNSARLPRDRARELPPKVAIVPREHQYKFSDPCQSLPIRYFLVEINGCQRRYNPKCKFWGFSREAAHASFFQHTNQFSEHNPICNLYNSSQVKDLHGFSIIFSPGLPYLFQRWWVWGGRALESAGFQFPKRDPPMNHGVLFHNPGYICDEFTPHKIRSSSSLAHLEDTRCSQLAAIISCELHLW